MKYIVFLLILTVAGHTFGQDSTAVVNKTQIKLKKKAPKKEESKFSSSLNLTMTTDSKRNQEKKSASSDIWYFLTYKMNSEYAVRLWVNTSKDLADSYKDTLNDTRVTFLKKSISLSDKLMVGPSVTLVMPTSENSKRNEELNAGVELNASLAYQFNKKLSASYLPRVVKNFHEYETSRTNTLNSEYKVIQFIGMSYSINDKWSFDPLLIYSTTWSYEGTRRDSNYLSILEARYRYSKTLSVAGGTTTGGSVLDRENGPDENVTLYDKNISSFYGNLVLRF